MSDEPRKVLSVQWVDAGFDLGGGDKADGPMTIVTVEGHIGSVGSGDTILYRRPTPEPPPAEVVQKHRSGCPMAGDIVGEEPHFTNKCRCRCAGEYDTVSAETVRAWVARGENRGAHLVLCVAEPKRTERGLSDVAFATLPHSWFPTLAPGECWPVEIRRVTEEAP